MLAGQRNSLWGVKWAFAIIAIFFSWSFSYILWRFLRVRSNTTHSHTISFVKGSTFTGCNNCMSSVGESKDMPPSVFPVGVNIVNIK